MSTVAKFKQKTEPEPQPDRLLNLREAAMLLALSEKSLYHRVARRTIPFRRLGRRVVFAEKDLMAYISALPRFEATE
jgi:excisionase family DNA binding protein